MDNWSMQPHIKTIPAAWTTRHYCPACRRVVVRWVQHGRWDPEREATAIPFEHVATTFKHYKKDLPDCVVGDITLSEPDAQSEAVPHD